MMELIERLRAPGSVKSWAEADAQRAEAAAEIERLRAALEAVMARVNQTSFGMGRDIREIAERALTTNF